MRQHFVTEMPGSWSERLKSLCEHVETNHFEFNDSLLVSSCQSSLSAAAYTQDGGMLQMTTGLASALCTQQAASEERPIEWTLSEDPSLTTTDSDRRKRERARAVLEAVGGLRDPRRSIAARPAALVGKTVLEILSKAAAAIDDEFDSLGTASETLASEAVAEKARAMLAEWLGVKVEGSGVQHEFSGALAKKSDDPYIDVLVWLKGRTPLGIT